jgi:hypothetical protein
MLSEERPVSQSNGRGLGMGRSAMGVLATVLLCATLHITNGDTLTSWITIDKCWFNSLYVINGIPSCHDYRDGKSGLHRYHVYTSFMCMWHG